MNQEMKPLYETMMGRIARDSYAKLASHTFVSHAPEPLPVLRYRNGRVYIDGEHDASRWFGLLRYENDRDDKVQLRLVDPRGDGSFPVELTPHVAFGFGRGEDLEERCFGVFLGVAENDVVNWAVAYDDPEHALRLSEQFLGVEPKTRTAHIEFDWYYGPTRTPEQVHDEYVRTLIARARCALRERQREPMKMSRVTDAAWFLHEDPQVAWDACPDAAALLWVLGARGVDTTDACLSICAPIKHSNELLVAYAESIRNLVSNKKGQIVASLRSMDVDACWPDDPFLDGRLPAEAQREWYNARLWSECHNVAVGLPRRAYAVPYYAGKLGGDPRHAVAVVRRRHPEERFTR